MPGMVVHAVILALWNLRQEGTVFKPDPAYKKKGGWVWAEVQWLNTYLACMRSQVHPQYSKTNKNQNKTKIPSHFFKFIYSDCTGFELGLPLARQAFYHLNYTTSPVLCWVFSR
jgi:hypothetical protein